MNMKELENMKELFIENIEHPYSECNITNFTYENDCVVFHLTDPEKIYKSITITEVEENKYGIKLEHYPDVFKDYIKIVEKEDIGKHLRRITTMVY
jgi:hypothetical protein